MLLPLLSDLNIPDELLVPGLLKDEGFLPAFLAWRPLKKEDDKLHLRAPPRVKMGPYPVGPGTGDGNRVVLRPVSEGIVLVVIPTRTRLPLSVAHPLASGLLYIEIHVALGIPGHGNLDVEDAGLKDVKTAELPADPYLFLTVSLSFGPARVAGPKF